ncbi:chemotaxis protein [Konateibacter massiliensis]|uniref:chemotaxis protein n=1 Tax=Konateibacter massiliensis TaxID=2002841 RepID=UPI000C15685C|nr:chemotaxis protein [Konateibacter massiliensis]
MDTNILLENGTNELEVLEFTLGGNHYGINVAKIREILTFQKVTPVPNAHPCIEGVFMPRDTMISVINLKKAINMNYNEDDTGLFIITNFNKLNIAFHVDAVLGIHRISWADIIKPDATINTAGSGVSTGIIKIDSKLIIILDFEKIVTDISPETGLKTSEIEALGERKRNDAPILVSEDSPLLSKLITDSLKAAGYKNLIVTGNGQEAWDWLLEHKKDGTFEQKVKCVITDIEMPLMDGHRLTKLIKTDSELSVLPVVIFSSLVNEEMRRKGVQLGADAQLSKPEIGNLVSEIDKLLAK